MPRFDKLVVLDLDETLIYAAEQELDRKPDFNVGRYFVYKRPGVREFLSGCLARFEVSVWTSATEDYAAQVVRNLFELPTFAADGQTRRQILRLSYRQPDL